MKEFSINLVLSIIFMALIVAPFVGCFYASNDFVITFMGGFLGFLVEFFIGWLIFSIWDYYYIKSLKG